MSSLSTFDSTVRTCLFAIVVVIASFGCTSQQPDEQVPNNGMDATTIVVDAAVDVGLDVDAADVDAEQPALTPTTFSVGYAEQDITPGLGTIMGGFGGPGDARRATGVNDPLMAQALFVTNDADDALLMITLDVAGMFYDFGTWGPGIREAREAISTALAPERSIEPHQIIISSSHTHAGTDLGGLNQAIGMGVPIDLLYDVQWQLVQLALAAHDAIAPADLNYMNGELSGWTKRDKDCSPVLDTSISTLLIDWEDESTPPLYLVNFANHPTVLGSDNTLLSADFIWGLRTAAANRDARAMFLQGFIAAVHGRYSNASTSGFERALEYGEVLFQAATAGPVTKEDTLFGIESREVVYGCVALDSFLSRVFRFLNMPKRGVTEQGENYFVETIPVSWHRIGNAEFAVWPGEPSPEYALSLKARMASDFKFTIGLGNDSIGYMVDPVSLEEDTSGRLTGYELMMGLGRESGPCAWRASESLDWFAPAPSDGSNE